MWPDNETSTDLIGFQVHSDLVRDVVTDPAMLPVTIGVFGDWGGGKTSIMRMLERSLDPERYPARSPQRSLCESIAVVYVNTWQFEGYDDAKSAILSSVLLQLKNHRTFGTKVQEGVLRLLKAVNWGRFVRLSLQHVAMPAAAALMTGGAAAVPATVAASLGLAHLLSPADATAAESTSDIGPELAELWQGHPDEQELDITAFRKQFESLLADADIASLVVLIDDLDRCTPDRIVDNLEAVKLFLSVDRTAFVIGADRRIVEHAIHSKYAVSTVPDSIDLDTEQLARDYLEKVVQIPYTLPRLSASEVETYMVLLFCQRHLSRDDLATCVAASQHARAQNRYGTFGYGGVKAALAREPEGAFAADLVLAAAAAPMVADGLKGNPRQVKRFLNAFLLRRKLAQVARLEDFIRTDVLIKLMVLEYVAPKQFTELFTKLRSTDGRVPLLGDLEEAASDGKPTRDVSHVHQSWTTTWANRWLTMEPHLADLDLRDYFWVARDRLESTLAGITMVPPVVRSVFNDLFSGRAPKRHSAVKTARQLQPDEVKVLFGLVEQHIANKPTDGKSWGPLRALADASLRGASECLASLVLKLPAARLPAALGLNLVNLHNDRTDLRATLGPVIDHLRSAPSTRIGKAVNSAELRT